MRKTNLKFLTCLAMTLAALAAPLNSAHGQAVTPIFNFTDQLWSYFQTGAEPANIGGVNWKTNTYNDSAWATGYGTLSFESDTGNYPWGINTILDRTNASGAQIITYYFRTHFNFPTNPFGVVLYFTNVVDDGCIVYLNGFEMHRIRMPAGAVTAATPATGTGTEGARELNVYINSPRLRQGDNVIAVELHDTTGSSDVDWTLGLAYRLMIPITITRQPPTPVNAQVGDTVDLSVDVTGEDPRYWWFRNNVFLTNQTNSLLRLNNIQLSSAGTYHVVVSNVISGARSSNSVVSVVVDTFPPELIGATINEGDTNRVYALFSEDVLRVNNRNFLMSATNIDNYFLKEVATTNEIKITAALPSVGLRAVRLTLATNIDCSKEYVLRVSNLTDLRTNLMSPNPGYAIVGCVYRTNLVEFQRAWKWKPAWGFDPPPANWYATNYFPDANWGDGVAPFYYSQECETFCFGNIGALCPGFGTPIDVGYPTYVFRTEFIVPSNSPTVGQLRLAHVVDDGAIFYLNGRELLRYNMTNGPVDVDYLTTCLEPSCQTNVYALDNLLIGTNVFAVEVHECDEFTGADMMFGIQLDIIVTNFPTAIPEIKVTRNASPRQVRLNWQPRGWRLQTTTTITGGWVNVSGVTTNITGYTNTLPFSGNRFYRLCRP